MSHPLVPGSNAPHEDGPHEFETRWHDGDSLHCDYCGQIAADPIHLIDKEA